MSIFIISETKFVSIVVNVSCHFSGVVHIEAMVYQWEGHHKNAQSDGA